MLDLLVAVQAFPITRRAAEAGAILAHVTLILAMNKPEGIYLSVDYRVTSARTGKLIDDASVKFLSVTYPPDKAGPRALFAYTGLAILPDGTPTGIWLRETLRGNMDEVANQSIMHLRARLDRDIAHLRVPLIVNVLALHGERRYFGGLSNIRQMAPEKQAVMPSFGYAMEELPEPCWYANGSGTAGMVDRHVSLVNSQVNVVPKRPLDHMKLLATVNRRVATADNAGRVSPFCHVSFLNATERHSPMSRVFTEHGEDVPFEVPAIVMGIDVTTYMRRFVEKSKALFEGKISSLGLDEDRDLFNHELQRRP